MMSKEGMFSRYLALLLIKIMVLVAAAHPTGHSGLFRTPAPQELILDRLEGAWELESWDDGGTVSTIPEVSGRWFFAEGELAVILHDRRNKEEKKSVVGWGHSVISEGKFEYRYTERTTINGTDEGSTLTEGPAWDGLRPYNVYVKGDGIIMESESGKQAWEVYPERMIYTDFEWMGSGEKSYAQRKWVRIPKPNAKRNSALTEVTVVVTMEAMAGVTPDELASFTKAYADFVKTTEPDTLGWSYHRSGKKVVLIERYKNEDGNIITAQNISPGGKRYELLQEKLGMLKVTEVDVYGGFTDKLKSFNAKAAEELDFGFPFNYYPAISGYSRNEN